MRLDLGIVDCPKEHAEHWELLRVTGALGVFPEELRDEYFLIPRGRVFFDCNNNRSVVYMGDIPDEGMKAKIIEAFELDPDATDFKTDEHYAAFSDEEWDIWRNGH